MIFLQITDEKGKTHTNPLAQIVSSVSVSEPVAVQILELWIRDYEEIAEIVKNSDKTLEELAKQLNGHNLDEELFDVNFKNILTTVTNRNGKLEVTSNFEGYFDGEIRELCDEEDYTEYPISTLEIDIVKLALKQYKEQNK